MREGFNNLVAHGKGGDDFAPGPRSSPLDLAAIRARLDAARGREYWRGLEELANSEGFQALLHREFPRQASEWNDPVGRRKFLKLMGASLALAGLTGCWSQPAEQIVPYVRQPEGILLGRPLFFATAMPLGGVASGLLIESREGRPIKVEGNPDHPASLGATDMFAQASLLTLYDPDRAQTVTNIGEISSYPAFLGAIRPAVEAQRALRGAGLRILTETVTSPTLTRQLGALLTEMPAAKWHQYDPARGDGARAGSVLAFGVALNTIYHFDQADVILSLDSDFLTCGPGSIRYVRDFSARRRLEAGKTDMNRLYVVESTPTNTGAKADHRLALPPSAIESLARSVASGLGVQTGPNTGEPPHTSLTNWVAAVVSDLRQHRGSGIIIAGDYQPPIVHAMAHAMNHALGNIGETVLYTDALETNPVDQIASLRDLVRDMDAGRVDLLVIAGSNPVHTAPADLNFAGSLSKARLRIHSSCYYDETSELCHWHIPQTHYLEAWSDARAYDGTASIIQPLIAPLYHGRTPHELFAAFTDQPERPSYEIVRAYWKTYWAGGGRVAPLGSPAGRGEPARQTGRPGTTGKTQDVPLTPASPQLPEAAADFEKFWRKALHDGFIAGTALPAKAVSMRAGWSGQAAGAASQNSRRAPPSTSQPALEIIFRPDPTIYDGQFANNGWLQELPKPLTKLTWDNAALVSPATAERFGLSQEIARRGGEHGQVWADMVEIRYQGRKLSTPVWIVPGHADNCVTLHLGYGRWRAGRIGTGTGFNAYAVRPSNAPWFGPGLEISKTGGQYPLACTQFHHAMEGRNLVRAGTLGEYRENPHFAKGEFPEPLKTPSLYPDYEYKGYAWGMAIDLSSCVGCSACVVACNAENNIPIVGKEEVMHGREMHWLRVDRYFNGGLDNPQAYFQPVPCMHCENAPCEPVCPVNATVHSAEGLNDMVYNRCVGTRYCQNNCPYKVRRFNFFQYSDWDTPAFKLLRNPEVSVRSRGVMEKCTYCVQRINHAKINSERENRQVRDGEILTACQAACPADAIIFGDINDPSSRVAKMKAEPRNYGLLAELNTRPRTTYLAEVRNPNPDLERA
jgi:MoCo/4Fe-4S cofactor protein with predicted Tat translocation signal